jgi:LacI family transcriptional regulator
MPSTIRDVARACDVHVSTVSRTFSAPHLVNARTRARILEAAERLGYRPNRAARSLVTGRTGNIGVIVADIANPFFPPLIKAAEQQARARGYHVFVADTDEDCLVEIDLIRELAKQVDGVVLCSPRMGNTALGAVRGEVGLVAVNRVVPGVPSVIMDAPDGARQALSHLTSLGHRQVALLVGPRGSWTSARITRAVTTTARSSGITVTVSGPHRPTDLTGRRTAAEIVRTGASAVLAYNDLMALGLLEGLDSLGVRVPQDLSVVGIDDIPMSRFARPHLTTVAMPTAAAGRAAVDLLLREESSETTEEEGGGTRGIRLTLPTTLVIRDSTGPAPAGRAG